MRFELTEANKLTSATAIPPRMEASLGNLDKVEATFRGGLPM